VDDDYDEVYAVPQDGVAVVTSHTARADYRGMTRQEAMRYLIAHQRVVEEVMRDFPVLPVKFGTVLPSEDSLHRLLLESGALFQATLKEFACLVQMELVVLWNQQQVFQEISQEEPIARLKAQLADRPPQETVQDRIALGQMVVASLMRRRHAIQERLLASLREMALDLLVNPLMDDSMVTNLALLLDGADREALDRKLQLLDEEFESRLHFRCVGPLPPYSFATVELQVPSFESVDEARRALGLGEIASAGEIKQAYRRLASQFHPDRHPGDAQAQTKMMALTKAYTLLTAYAENQALKANAPQEAACCFDRQTVEQTLLTAIRRQQTE